MGFINKMVNAKFKSEEDGTILFLPYKKKRFIVTKDEEVKIRNFLSKYYTTLIVSTIPLLCLFLIIFGDYGALYFPLFFLTVYMLIYHIFMKKMLLNKEQFK